MPQVAVQQPAKKRKTVKTAARNVSAEGGALMSKSMDNKAGKAPLAKKSAAMQSTSQSSTTQTVAKIVRGEEARQLLLDAGILTAAGNVRRRFK